MTTKTYSLLFSLFILSYILLSGCADLSTANQPQSAAAPGSVTISDENGNRVVLETDRDNQALIQIFSEQGYGAIDINIADAAYPSSITVRLYLHGLEGLALSYGDNTRRIAISPVPDGSGNIFIGQWAIDATDERELHPNSPEWWAIGMAEIGAKAESALTTIPLEDGYIDVTLPQSFIDEQIRDFSIEWVDFFR